MKNKQIYIIAGIFAALAAAAYFLIFKKSEKETDAAALTVKADVDTHKEVIGHAKFPLIKGSRGIEVMYLQAFLNMYKGAKIVDLDGIYGKETQWNANEYNGGVKTISKLDYDAMMLLYYPQLKAYLIQKGVKV